MNEAPIDTSVGVGGTVVAGAAVAMAADVGATVEVGAAVVVTPPAPPPSSPLPPLPVVVEAAAPLMPAWASSRVEDDLLPSPRTAVVQMTATRHSMRAYSTSVAPRSRRARRRRRAEELMQPSSGLRVRSPWVVLPFVARDASNA